MPRLGPRETSTTCRHTVPTTNSSGMRQRTPSTVAARATRVRAGAGMIRALTRRIRGIIMAGADRWSKADFEVETF